MAKAEADKARAITKAVDLPMTMPPDSVGAIPVFLNRIPDDQESRGKNRAVAVATM